MAAVDVLNRLWANLLALGPRRLAALGLTGIAVFLLVGVSGYLLSRPSMEVLYSGLDPQDVTRMGGALEEAGIDFDISIDGNSIMVGNGEAARARMLLAQKGLPRSDTAGYELFDKLGSLGLTTFMQQVTKVRALEGELARTIQLIDGIRAARVHIAMQSEGNFRGTGQKATASVIIRALPESGESAAEAIRNLVAAAIPGLSPQHVSVMTSDGRMLSSPGDPVSAAPERLMGLERSVAADLEAKIARTIVPYLGLGNFRISVAAKLNADRRQISETSFDPNSRVERSVRTIRESGEAQNASADAAVTVEQNIPVEETPKGSGDSSSERKDRKEELTNYEINSRSVSTTSEGYGIDRLSVALVVNRAQLARMLGAEADEEKISAKVSELQQLASSAAGLLEARGDILRITAVDFAADDALEPLETEGGIVAVLGNQAGALINAGALILVTLLVLMLGLRPALKMIAPGSTPQIEAAGALPGVAQAELADLTSAGSLRSAADAAPALSVSGDPMLDSILRGAASDPRDRLHKIVEVDPDRAAEVLKKWLQDTAQEAA